MASGDTAAVIGKSVQIRGEVRGSEDLLVEGQVEGTIDLTESRLTIGAHARVQANLSARDVVIIGNVTGNISATGRVELRSGSSVKGDLRAGRLAIEENAVFSGKVELTSSASTATTAERPAAQATAAPPAPSPAPVGART